MRIVKLYNPTINSTSVAGSSYAAYNSATPYVVGSLVSGPGLTDSLTHEYESVYGTVDEPNTGNPLSDPTRWLDLGATNNQRMFDFGSNSKTISSSTITCTISPGVRFDSISLSGVYGAESVRVVVTANGETLYDITENMKDRGLGAASASFSEYFFGDRSRYKSNINFDVNTLYTSASVAVTITKNTLVSEVSCASLVVGRARSFGFTLDGVTIDRESYSSIETDLYGTTRFVKRPTAKRATAKIIIDSAYVDALNTALADIGGEPAFIDLNNEGTSYAALALLGFYEDFSIDLTFNKSHCSLSVIEVL